MQRSCNIKGITKGTYLKDTNMHLKVEKGGEGKKTIINMLAKHFNVQLFVLN